MSQGLLLIDGRGISFAANARKGARLHVGSQETTAIFGFLQTLRVIRSHTMLLTPVVLWDGISWRKRAFPGYKASRDKPDDKHKKHLQELRASLMTQLPILQKAIKFLGVTQIKAMNLEADDLAGILVRQHTAKGKRITLLTADKDWAQLVGPRCSWFDPIHNQRLNLLTFEKELGVKDPKRWLEYKALVGDQSDDIPGVGGIGEKGAKEFLRQFGSVGEFFNQSIDGTLPKKLPKKFQTFADSIEKHDLYQRNLSLMDLNSPMIPAPVNLEVTKSEFQEEKFRRVCEILAFNKILADPDWCAPFQQKPLKEAA